VDIKSALRFICLNLLPDNNLKWESNGNFDILDKDISVKIGNEELRVSSSILRKLFNDDVDEYIFQ